jgi:hypothetical protein
MINLNEILWKAKVWEEYLKKSEADYIDPDGEDNAKIEEDKKL